MSELLTARNPELGSIEEAKLSFAQKLALIGTAELGVSYLVPGIRRLNTIRNRLAHTLSAEISTDDVNVFLGIALFRALREELAKPGLPSSDPADILEAFAKHVGITLHAIATRNPEIWAKAVRLAQADDVET
ncbi:MAG: hypothetical protein AABO41_15195 [Acidobacteriota bacterium]